jgi:hypothetical protein
METPLTKKRTDRFQRILITLFFKETLTNKERSKVIWIVRLASSAVVMVAAMVITLITESILDFFWFILCCILLYSTGKVVGALRKRLKRER